MMHQGLPRYLAYKHCTVLVFVCLLSLAGSGALKAQSPGTYVDLHDFGGTVNSASGILGPDGTSPSGVVFDKNGNLFGTAEQGGSNGGLNDGMIWEILANGTYKDLHDFGGTIITASGTSGPDGGFPEGTIAFDGAGNMYGTASGEGGLGNDGGMVWEITTSGIYKDLHDFGSTTVNTSGSQILDGSDPVAGVTFDSAGNMYGTTLHGGVYNAGIVWEITSSGVYKDLHDFGGTVTNSNGMSGPDGQLPFAGVTFDSMGDMFGTASGGGGFGNGAGMVWEISSNGAYRDLHDFGGVNPNFEFGPDGESPYADVTFDYEGNMYGTTSSGGLGKAGIVWEISFGEYSDLHDFGSLTTNADDATGPDGANPFAGVTFDVLGNMYGTTQGGGANAGNANGAGMVWELTPAGAYKDLHDFGGTVKNANGANGPDGINSAGGVVFDAAGNMLGTSFNGGANSGLAGEGCGIVWELTGVSSTNLAAPTNLTATGGSDQVLLSWTGNAQANQYFVYRATSSGGEGATPLFVIIGTLGPGPWTLNDTDVTNGTTYFYEVTAVSRGGQSGRSNEASVTPFTPLIYQAGLQMFSVPYDYAGVALTALFGYANPTLAVWSPANNQYAITPTAPADQVSLGQGYWVRFPQQVAITTPGTPADPTKNFDIPLAKGWNMIGAPFVVPVPVANLTFNGGTETFTQATTGNTPLIGATVWGYPAGSTAYTPATSLVPEQGYWIFALSATDVQVPHP